MWAEGKVVLQLSSVRAPQLKSGCRLPGEKFQLRAFFACRHVLTLAIQDAVASEEVLLAAAKEKLKQIEAAEISAEEAQHLDGESEEMSGEDAAQKQAEI